MSNGNDENPQNPRLTIVEATPDNSKPADTSIGPRADFETRFGEEAARKQQGPLNSQQQFFENVVQTTPGSLLLQGQSGEYFGTPPVLSPSMLHRKIWVRRSGASATLVQISEDDLVDDARDKVLRKYANSLGKTFDSPDVTLRIIPREGAQSKHGNTERSLGPEESIARTLDAYYPGGQNVDDALIIDIPHRRTPRHSPRIYSDTRPAENAADYFSVMPVALNHSPHLPSSISVAGSTGSGQQIHAMSVLNTGHVPPLPSPGASGRPVRHGSHRPKIGRTSTSSPTILPPTAAHQGTTDSS